jgi:hypothetical protein
MEDRCKRCVFEDDCTESDKILSYMRNESCWTPIPDEDKEEDNTDVD